MTPVYLCLAIMMEPGECLDRTRRCREVPLGEGSYIECDNVCRHIGAPKPVPHYRYVLEPIPGWRCTEVGDVPTVEEEP